MTPAWMPDGRRCCSRRTEPARSSRSTRRTVDERAASRQVTAVRRRSLVPRRVARRARPLAFVGAGAGRLRPVFTAADRPVAMGVTCRPRNRLAGLGRSDARRGEPADPQIEHRALLAVPDAASPLVDAAGRHADGDLRLGFGVAGSRRPRTSRLRGVGACGARAATTATGVPHSSGPTGRPATCTTAGGRRSSSRRPTARRSSTSRTPRAGRPLPADASRAGRDRGRRAALQKVRYPQVWQAAFNAGVDTLTAARAALGGRRRRDRARTERARAALGRSTAASDTAGRSARGRRGRRRHERAGPRRRSAPTATPMRSPARCARYWRPGAGARGAGGARRATAVATGDPASGGGSTWAARCRPGRW